jgi:hypothetical protein
MEAAQQLVGVALMAVAQYHASSDRHRIQVHAGQAPMIVAWDALLDRQPTDLVRLRTDQRPKAEFFRQRMCGPA